MLIHYLKIGLRNLQKRKGYTLINIAGLAVGIAACLVIFAFVREELRFDRFHTNLDRIYRIYSSIDRPDGMRFTANAPMPMGPTLQSEHPEVEQFVRLMDGSTTVEVGSRRFNQAVVFTDPAFFDVFTFPLVRGNERTALRGLDGIVLTETTARKLFGDDDPLGQTVTLHLTQVEDFVVTGVVADLPQASTVQFEMLVRFEKNPHYAGSADSWDNWNHQLFVQLAPNTDAADLERRLVGFSRKYLGEYLDHLNQTYGDPASGEDVFHLRLQPLRDVHFDTRMDMGQTGSLAFTIILSVVALMVLGSGCINFVNLSLGQAAARVKEVGVRKVVGATRRQLIAQFWGETTVLCTAALLLGAGLAELALPPFNAFLRRDLSLDLFTDRTTLPALLALLALTVALAASYPSLYLARFQPADVLKGQFRPGGRGLFRSGLLTFQFTLAILLILCTFVMTDQLTFLRSQDPGFEQEQIVAIPVSRQDGDRLLPLFKNRLMGEPGVVRVTGATNRPGVGPTGGIYRSIITFQHQDTEIYTHLLRVDPDYLETFGLELVEGSNFRAGQETPVPYVLINETLARRIKAEPVVGATLAGFELYGAEPVVLGVVRDFHFESLRSPVEPLLIHAGPGTSMPFFFVRITPDDVPATLRAIERHWEAIAPETPFQYSFVDEDVDRQYRAEERQIQVATTAAGLAILITCLGLFGLSVMAVSRRIKEIGIRKILGASVPGLVFLIAREFVLLVGLAFVIAAPLGYLAMDSWLQQFAYRITPSPLSFAAAGLIAFAIAAATVSYHAVRAAVANPVNALRYE